MLKYLTNLHYFFQEPIYLDKCIICWEQDWEDSFEIQDFNAKESFLFSVSSVANFNIKLIYYYEIHYNTKKH
jgi:hypothetical protein